MFQHNINYIYFCASETIIKRRENEWKLAVLWSNPKEKCFWLDFFCVFDINIHSGTLIFMSLDGFYVSFLVIMTIVHNIFNYVLYTWEELQQNSQFIQHKNLWVHNNDSKIRTILAVHLLKMIVAKSECRLVE